MFKWKVYVYKNINWREEKLEREFDNPQDFQSFAKANNVWWLGNFTKTMFGLNDRVNLNNYFDNLVDRKLWLTYHSDNEAENENSNSYLVDLDQYEKEIEKIEYKKQHKDESIKSFKKTLWQLKDYKKKFKEEGRDDMIEKIDIDIKKIEDEIDNLNQ